MDIWVVSSFWLLWIKLLWTFKYKFLHEHTFSVLWGIYIGVKLLGSMDWVIYQCHFIFPPTVYKCPNFSTTSTTFVIFHFLNTVIRMEYCLVKWHLIVVLICISIMASHDVYWPFVYLLWRTFYSSPLLIFNWVVFLLLDCKNSLCILDSRFLSNVFFANIFSHLDCCLFTTLIMSFDEK